MSIITKGGDKGKTNLLFGHRIEKSELRMELLGAIDEMVSAIGLSRAGKLPEEWDQVVDQIQEQSIGLMGFFACLPEDRERYKKRGYAVIGNEEVEWLEELARKIEAEMGRFSGWARPGAEHSLAKAGLDYARTIARRAERLAWKLKEEQSDIPDEILRYLNRLSDILWLIARVVKVDS